MIENLPELVNGDTALVRRGRHMHCRFMVEVGDDQYLITVDGGTIASVEKGPFVMRGWSFALRASEDVWARFWQAIPEPGYHDIFALLRKSEIAFDGDLRPLMANLLYVKQVLATPRRLAEVS